jgi:hypothetical protein
MNNFLSLTTIGLVALPALGAGDFNIDAERDERMKELVREVLADADSRSSFQGNAGPRGLNSLATFTTGDIWLAASLVTLTRATLN